MVWPTSVAGLAKLESWLWILVAVFAVAAALVTLLAREVGRQRASLEKAELQTRLDDALATRDEKVRELERIATDAKTGAAVLQERFKPRTLNDDQKAKMISVLSEEKAGSVYLIGAVAGDGEALAFSKEVIEVFRKSHWLIENTAANYVSTDNPVGMVIVVQSQHTEPPRLDLIRRAFRGVGISWTQRVDANKPHGSISLIVGHKPN